MARRRTTVDWGIAAALSLIWGTAFLLTRIALGSIPPATLATLRLGVAAAVLCLQMRVARHRFPTSGRVWLHFAVLGLLGNALPFFLLSWGQQRITSSLAGILMATIPLVTLVLAHFFDGDRMTPPRVAGFVLGFAGVVVLIGPDALRQLGGSQTEVVSQLAALAAALCWAGTAIVAARLPAMHATVAAAGTLLAGTALTLPLALAWEQPWHVAVTPGALAAALWLGVVATAVADTLYYRLIAGAGPTFFALINYVVPVVAAVAGVVVLDETLPATALAALVLILIGLALGQRPGVAAPKTTAFAADRPAG